MKLNVKVDMDDLTEDTQFNLNYRFKQEIIEQVIDRIYEKLTADWQNEVLDQVGYALENWIGERVDHIINQNIDKIINQLLKNKLSVALSRIVE